MSIDKLLEDRDKYMEQANYQEVKFELCWKNGKDLSP